MTQINPKLIFVLVCGIQQHASPYSVSVTSLYFLAATASSEDEAAPYEKQAEKLALADPYFHWVVASGCKTSE